MKMFRKHPGESKLFAEKHLSMFVSLSLSRILYIILQCRIQRNKTLIVSDNLSHVTNRISTLARMHTDTCTYRDGEAQKLIHLALIAIAAVVTALLLWSG